VTNPDVPPGRDVRCIIVSTVTQVVELRSFGSQLLCKPMVDRRAPADVLLFETAQIFGAPSELIPFKMEGGMPQVPLGPSAAHNHILRRPRNGLRVSEPL